MNWFAFIAGLLGASTTAGHFLMGGKTYLKPVLDSSIDPVPKRVMQAVFHYVSTFLILSTIVILLVGVGVDLYDGSSFLLRFIAANYAVFAMWEIVLAITSDIEKGLAKMFHWVFFVLIAVFAFLGS